MNILTTQFLKRLTLITLIIVAFGIIINNIYLGQFNIYDFNLLQSRSIFIGFTFSVFILAHVIYYLALIDTKNILNNTPFEIFYKTLIKLIIFTNFLFFTLNQENLITLHNKSGPIDRLLILSNFTAFLVIIILYALEYSVYKATPKRKIVLWTFKYPVYFFVILSISSFIYNLISFPSFRHIINYEFYFAFFFYLILLDLYFSKKDESNGTRFKNYSFFSSSEVDGKYWVEKIFIFVYIIGMLTVLIFNYSTQIYPSIDIKYGGGEPRTLKIDYKNQQIEGKLIYQDAYKYYLLKDSTILFIDKNNVDRLYLNKALHPTQAHSACRK